MTTHPSPRSLRFSRRGRVGQSGPSRRWVRWMCCAALATVVAVAPLPARAQDPAPSPDSAFVPAGYVNVFRDEMDGRALDTSKWWTRYIYEDGKLATLNDERQLYGEDGNHVLTGGALHLTARLAPDLKPPRWRYTSGMIRSKPTFKYGYFEARVKVPAGRGCWPGFWLNADADEDGKAEWPPEIDILEFVNNGGNDRPNMMHMGVVVSRHKNPTPNPWGGEILAKHDLVTPRGKLGGAIYHAPFEFPDEFHIIGGLWDTDDTVSIFVDGELMVKFAYRWLHTDGRPAPYAHVLLNLAIGGSWAGQNGIDDDAFPQAFEIDYVRVYQKAAQGMMGRSTIGHDLLQAAPVEAREGPTPYPDKDDTSAWPGTGPIRVFPWMVENRAFFWTQRDKSRDAVVFAGDSLVGNWKGLKDAFPGRKVGNRGIGGDVSRGLLFRFQEDVLDLEPAAIVLLVGTNDLSAHADVEGVIENLGAMVEQAKRKDPGMKVILNTVPPRAAANAPAQPGAVAALNARMAAFAADRENVILVDLHAALAGADGAPDSAFFQKDLLHLGPKGYAKWAELLQAALPEGAGMKRGE